MQAGPRPTGPRHKPLRIAGLVAGGLVLALSAGPWVLYIRATLRGFDPEDPDPGITDENFVNAFFGAWSIPWLVGLALVLTAGAGWLRRTSWALIALTGAMLAAALTTYAIGSA